MEMLQVIKAKMDTQVTVVPEIFGPTLEHQSAGIMSTIWPPYGLPPGFSHLN